VTGPGTVTTKCAAYMPDLNARCGDPGLPVRRACACEHVLDTVACAIHIAMAQDSGYCLTCYEIDGHECPITVIPLAEVTP
jgi:hypothetical protein